jgi:hypothetical protein
MEALIAPWEQSACNSQTAGTAKSRPTYGTITVVRLFCFSPPLSHIQSVLQLNHHVLRQASTHGDVFLHRCRLRNV